MRRPRRRCPKIPHLGGDRLVRWKWHHAGFIELLDRKGASHGDLVREYPGRWSWIVLDEDEPYSVDHKSIAELIKLVRRMIAARLPGELAERFADVE